MVYVTISEIRAGAAIPPLADPPTDTQLLVSILKWQDIIEKITRNFFEPRLKTIRFDGNGGSILHCPFPIIAVENLYVNDSTTAESADDYIVYDIESHNGYSNPKILLKSSTSSSSEIYNTVSGSFLKGNANQIVEAYLGYVRPDSESFEGVTTAEFAGNTSPDELTITGDQTTRDDVIYTVEITTGGVYGVFEANVSDSDGNVVLASQVFISGTGVLFDQELNIVFTDAGGSVMVSGDKWYITSAYDGVPLPIKYAITKLVLSKDFPDESLVYPGGVTGVLSKERTDGHELKWSQRKMGSSEYLGLIDDDEILEILMMYKGPRIIQASSI